MIKYSFFLILNEAASAAIRNAFKGFNFKDINAAANIEKHIQANFNNEAARNAAKKWAMGRLNATTRGHLDAARDLGQKAATELKARTNLVSRSNLLQNDSKAMFGKGADKIYKNGMRGGISGKNVSPLSHKQMNRVQRQTQKPPAPTSAPVPSQQPTPAPAQPTSAPVQSQQPAPSNINPALLYGGGIGALTLGGMALSRD